MKKKLQVAILALVAAGFVLAPAQEAKAIGLTGLFNSIGLGALNPTIGAAYNTVAAALTTATNAVNSSPAPAQVKTLTTNILNGVGGLIMRIFGLPIAPPPPPPPT